jgi:hypothetical protein
MKRVYHLIILLLCLSGCDELFHTEELSIGKIGSHDELVTATYGVYGKLSGAFHDLRVYSINYNGDDLSSYGPSYMSAYGDNFNCMLFEKTFHTSDIWDLLYSTLASVNSILSQYDNLIALGKPATEILGEMYFFRAYLHFRLTRTFGEIPIVDNIEVSYTTGKASYTEVYEFIENDLKKAISLLPDNNSSARIPYETPNRGTAKALLAEVYLSWAGYPVSDVSKYALAASKAGEVIDSASYFGFGLVYDFASLWDQQHRYNQEEVISFFYSDPTKATSYEGPNFFYRGYASVDHTNDYFKTSPNSYYMGDFLLSAELKFYNSYPSCYRKEITFFSTVYVPKGSFLTDTGYVHIDKVEGCNRMGFRKFTYDPVYVAYQKIYPDFPIERWLVFGMDRIYILRYAQTVLTYAEAAARSGQLTDKAYECVNQIRRRAHRVDLYSPSVYDLQPGLSADAFADSVVQERAWELAGEPEVRWFDIVRLDRIEELRSLRDPEEGGTPYSYEKSEYYYPVPEGDIILNPNLGDE